MIDPNQTNKHDEYSLAGTISRAKARADERKLEDKPYVRPGYRKMLIAVPDITFEQVATICELDAITKTEFVRAAIREAVVEWQTKRAQIMQAAKELKQFKDGLS